MKRNIAVLALMATGMAGVIHAPAEGATAIAMDNQDIVYYVTHPSLDQAHADVLNYCVNEGGQGCTVIGTNAYSGYGAVAQSARRWGTAMGYASQEEANRAALDGCGNQNCQVTLEFFDGNGSRPSSPTGCINPATGLPMVSGECWGVDIQGNPYGIRLP